MHDPQATIVAVATPGGRGGIGCIRLSGGDSAAIARRLFRATGTQAQAGGPPSFGRFLDLRGTPIDRGYLLLFAAGRSYTGEPSAELWAHGSPPVLAALVEAAIAAGARPAGPGEFTYRAVRNGRLDLARAEAVRDLVEARTLFQARVAFAQVEGALSRRLAPMREALEEWIARAEAAVEFVEETETGLAHGALRNAIVSAELTCDELLVGFRTGQIVREGAGLVVTGRPNVGKSSLFNRLLGHERAIVTEQPGTTRDTLEEAVDLGGIPVRLIDTAGLRDAIDPAEGEGVRRARRAREQADLVLLVLDGSRPLDTVERESLAELGSGPQALRTVVAMNKNDLREARDRPLPLGLARRVSARTGEGVAELRAVLRERLVGTGPIEDPIVTNARHARALEEAREALARATAAVDAGLSEELVLEDLREALRALGEITGEFTTDALYERIFSTFCIGK